MWLAVVSWRPFSLGFYHDDWAILRKFPTSQIPKTLEELASRPLYGFLLVFFRTLLPFDPVFWHILLGILVAASALAIGLFSKQLAKYITDDQATAEWSGAIASATWIATPWDLGVTAWPTTFNMQISVIGFCLVGYVTINNESLKSKFAKALPVFLVSSLISELFWLSFIPLILISMMVEHKSQSKHRKWREAMLLFVGFCVVQLFLVGLNRGLAYAGIGISKTFNTIWLNSTFLSLRLLPAEFDRSVVWPLASWITLCTMFVTLILCAAFHPKRKLIGGALLAIASGGLLSLVLFAVAGYRVEAIGTSSRTTAAISVWLSLIPALTLAVSEHFGRAIQRFALAAVLLVVLIFSASSIHNLQAWIKSWKFEKQLLRDFPAAEIAQSATRNSFVLVDAEHPSGYAEGFEAFWDIGGALYASYPIVRQAFAPDGFHDFATMANISRMRTSWDGSRLVQSWCSSPQSTLWGFAAQGDLYLWKQSGQELVRLTAPVDLGCEHK